jgi:Spx/MgsR family transcriptional regulator
MSFTIYGIKNCDTMKKARAWLDKRGVAYAFHDYKTAGIERDRLERWERKIGWETLLNRAGTTFRKLPDKDKANLDAKKAMALMLAQPSMIKRPVLDLGGGKLLVGFTPELYAETVGKRLAPKLCASGVAPLPQLRGKKPARGTATFQNC